MDESGCHGDVIYARPPDGSPAAAVSLMSGPGSHSSAMKSRYSVTLVLLLSTLSVGMSPGLADKRDKKNEHNVVREALQRGEVLPLEKILTIAKEQVPGDVIEVELEDEKKALVYEIKILTSTGRVREVKIDARTGKVIKIEDD